LYSSPRAAASCRFCSFSPDPQLTSLVKWLCVGKLDFQASETGLELVDIFKSPGFLDRSLEHERMGGALPEAEKLDHECTIVATGFATPEKGIEICPKAIFSLFRQLMVQHTKCRLTIL